MNIQKIPKIVINLPSRRDRLCSVNIELDKVFYSLYTHISNGVIGKTPMDGIAQAHMNAVSYAKACGFEEVLIMEDDVKFIGADKLKSHLTNLFNNLPNEWDILLGGVSESDGLSIKNEWWNKTKQFCGLHFYILPAHMYDVFLSYPGGYHIDRWFNMNNQHKCFVSRKMFAIQSSGFSDNTMKKENYTDLFNKFELLK